MKTLIAVLTACLLWAGSALANPQGLVGGVIRGSGGGASAGFVGTKNGTLQSSGVTSARSSYYSDFTATAGPVSYMYLDIGRNDLATVVMRMSISSDAGVLIESTDCTMTNISGTLYRAALAAPVELTATTYRLSFTFGQTYANTLYVSSTAGAAAKGPSYLYNECPTDAHTGNITYGSNVSASYSFSIWASNSDSDTHE